MRNVDESIRVIRPYRLYSTVHTVARPDGARLVVSKVASFKLGERHLEGWGHLTETIERRAWSPQQIDPWTVKQSGELLIEGRRWDQPVRTQVWSPDRAQLLVDRSVVNPHDTPLDEQSALRSAVAQQSDPWDIQLAPEDQRLREGFFQGGEWLRLENVHPDQARYEVQLPELRARTFARRAGQWEELPSQLDTVRLFPKERRGMLVWRALGETDGALAHDVDTVISGVEPLGDPRPASYYHELAARHRDGPQPVILHDGELLPEVPAPCTTCRHRVDRAGWHCDRVTLAELRRDGHPLDGAPPRVDRMGCRHHEPRRASSDREGSPSPAVVAPSASREGPAPRGHEPTAAQGAPLRQGPGAGPSLRMHDEIVHRPPPPQTPSRTRRGLDENLRITLSTEAFDDTLAEIHTVRGRESISALPEYATQIAYKSNAPIDLDVAIGRPATLRVALGDDELRTVHGIIRDIESLYDTEDHHTIYRLTLVPRAYRLALEQRQEIHLDRSVPDIIRHKLAQSGLSDEGEDFEMRLHGDYPSREFVVQYRETDLAFVSRLAEHAGISFYFEHAADRDRIVFVDHTSGFPDVHPDARVPYHRRGEEIGCYQLRSKRKMVARSYTMRDYNYRTPMLDLTKTHELASGDSGTVVDWGAHFKTPSQGDQLATIRAQEAESARLVHEGTSDDPLLRAGTIFELVDHPQVEGRLLLTEVEVEMAQAFATGVARGDERLYVNRFKAIDAALHYRPPRVTPVPRIQSVISGYVQSASLGDIQSFAKIDDMGRYHVRFMFDDGIGEASLSSRPIRRAQPAVGPNYGLHFPLRPGMEVLMVFVDGDPDRPIIIGAVHHPLTPTPVAREDQTKNRLKTESGVLFEIEDGAGS